MSPKRKPRRSPAAMKLPKMPESVTLDELAAQYPVVSVRTLQRLVKTRKLKAFRNGRQIRVTIPEARAWAKARGLV